MNKKMVESDSFKNIYQHPRINTNALYLENYKQSSILQTLDNLAASNINFLK
jgi:hypothetical protein